MRQWQKVGTPMGNGIIIGHDEHGNYLVCIKAQDAKGITCTGPSIDIWFAASAVKELE